MKVILIMMNKENYLLHLIYNNYQSIWKKLKKFYTSMFMNKIFISVIKFLIKNYFLKNVFFFFKNKR